MKYIVGYVLEELADMMPHVIQFGVTEIKEKIEIGRIKEKLNGRVDSHSIGAVAQCPPHKLKIMSYEES